MSTEDAKAYLSKREIPQLFECLMTGLMYHRPRDHIQYLNDCLGKIKDNGLDHVRWNMFIEQRKKTPLPPISPQNGRSRTGSRAGSRSSSRRLSRQKSDCDRATTPVLPPIAGRKLNLPDIPIVVVIGGPGSGKGTQCKSIVQRYEGWVHLSMGDIIRTQVAEKGSADDKWDMVSTLLQKGEMAPEDITVDLLVENILKHKDAKGIIIEGFPRTMKQYQDYEEKIGKMDLVLLIDCEEFYLQNRLLTRGREAGRIDDNPAAVAQRILFFKNNTLPVIKEMDDKKEEKCLTFLIIDGDRDQEEVQFDMACVFDSAFYQQPEEGKPRQIYCPKPPPMRYETEDTQFTNASSRPGSCASIASLPPVTDIPDLVVTTPDTGRCDGIPTCPIIMVLGGPGSGKLTQCKKIEARYEGFVHISVGDELRHCIVQKGSADQKWGMIGKLVQEGEMAPEEETVDILLDFFKKQKDAKGIILEGYPRNAMQLEDFNRHIGGANIILLLDCDEFYMRQRLLNRGKETERVDDNLSAINKRISVFKGETLPVIKHYDGQGKLVIVNGDCDRDEISYVVQCILDGIFYGDQNQGQVEVDCVEQVMEAEVAPVTGDDDGNPAVTKELDELADDNKSERNGSRGSQRSGSHGSRGSAKSDGRKSGKSSRRGSKDSQDSKKDGSQKSAKSSRRGSRDSNDEVGDEDHDKADCNDDNDDRKSERSGSRGSKKSAKSGKGSRRSSKDSHGSKHDDNDDKSARGNDEDEHVDNAKDDNSVKGDDQDEDNRNEDDAKSNTDAKDDNDDAKSNTDAKDEGDDAKSNAGDDRD